LGNTCCSFSSHSNILSTGEQHISSGGLMEAAAAVLLGGGRARSRHTVLSICLSLREQLRHSRHQHTESVSRRAVSQCFGLASVQAKPQHNSDQQRRPALHQALFMVSRSKLSIKLSLPGNRLSQQKKAQNFGHFKNSFVYIFLLLIIFKE
jgi:hypothetical protein